MSIHLVTLVVKPLDIELFGGYSCVRSFGIKSLWIKADAPNPEKGGRRK